MNKKHFLSLVLVAMLLLSMLAGCGNTAPATQTSTPPAQTDAQGQRPVKITFMNTKGEIAAQLEDVAKTFMADNPGITLEIVPVPAGKSPFEAISAMYNSGNAPTLSMIDSGDIPRLKDNFLSLNNEKWLPDAVDGTTKISTIDGVTYAFPFTIEGFGLIYNKQVLDKAFGGSFDPKSITTRAALKDAFDKVEASGAKALIVAPMDWSLGAHMFSLNYIVEGKGNQAAYDKLFADLKSGSFDLANNATFNNWVDTFDILKAYNSAKADPLSVTYEKGPEMLGKSEVGFWYMGNWAWPQIKEFDTANGQYGFVPFPMSDNASDYGNNS
ncbi:MAG: ABC transporter substrate-binding protein, partial [Clostridia bacterium]|nr:ABC transporter substrate-binding protein [Clostridia bacterium]